MPGASRVGTVDLLKSNRHVFVDADLNPVAKGSPEAAFIFKRSDLDRVVARREELGLGKDEAARAQRESHARALADAERRAAAAQEEVAALRERVKAQEAAEKKATKKGGEA